MLRAAFAFLIFALIAAIFGFTGIAADSAWIARVLALVFAGMFLVAFLVGGISRKDLPPA